MGIDKRPYTLLQGMSETSRVMLFDHTKFVDLNHFLEAYITGAISNFKVSGFFQSTSDYVVDLMFLPIDLSKFGYLTDDYVYLGNHQYTDYACKVFMANSCATHKKIFSISITRNFNNFLDFAPYTKIKLYVPFFEVIEINPLKVYGKTLDGYVSIDARTGKFTLYLYINDDILYESRETNLGIKMGIGFTNAKDIMRNNLLSAIALAGGAANIAIGAAAGNPISVSGGVGMITKTATSIVENNVEHLKSYKGANGNFTELSVDKRIILITEQPKDITVPDVALKGGICKKNLSLSTVTGYTEIGEIHFNPKGNDIYDDEISELNDLLRSGIIL